MKLVAIVLTFNEEKHIARCLESIRGVAAEILVVDSFSADATCEIARALGARVLQRPWVNYAVQFNWALGQLEEECDWVLRIDADEILSSELATEMRERLPAVAVEVAGVSIPRRVTFQGQMIQHGGVSRLRSVRLFRRGRGRCENRWMDEHIKVEGKTVDFEGGLLDDNLNTLTWWTEKHNKYASREAVDLLNLEYRFMPLDSVAQLSGGKTAGLKRWVKEVVYLRMPRGMRAFAYFGYRYVLRLGFLDGPSGASFHVLQGFWYRYLVDAKVAEVKRYMKERKVGAPEAISKVLAIELAPSEVSSA